MKIIDQSWQWVKKPDKPLELIEQAGRTCYKSEAKITPESAEAFVEKLLKRNHASVIEHASATVKFITNRGVTHELVRHRLASYSQESTRYVKYDDVEFIRPVWWEKWDKLSQMAWLQSMETSEDDYKFLIKHGSRPQQAREVLPNSLKTEIVVTANIREWRHIFKLRCSKAAHPQIRHLMLDCLEGFKKEIPVLFDDI